MSRVYELSSGNTTPATSSRVLPNTGNKYNGKEPIVFSMKVNWLVNWAEQTHTARLIWSVT